VLMWVLEQDPPCPWNAETCAHAVKEGYLEARNQDPPCPWDTDTSLYAARGGYSATGGYLEIEMGSRASPSLPMGRWSMCSRISEGWQPRDAAVGSGSLAYIAAGIIKEVMEEG
jgi:hypothetical protein